MRLLDYLIDRLAERVVVRWEERCEAKRVEAAKQAMRDFYEAVKARNEAHQAELEGEN